MDENWTSGFCNEREGFLFKHHCDNQSTAVCAQCRKPICSIHSRTHESQVFCIACIKRQPEYVKSKMIVDTDDDDPYFYGQHYYHGYDRNAAFFGASFLDQQRGLMGQGIQGAQNDPDDFTEADAESLTDDGGADFESDINES